MSDEHGPLSFLSQTERRVLGPLVLRLWHTSNPRFQRALATTGAEATARMACVNALRAYATVLFAIGVVARVAQGGAFAYVLFALAGACMVWSFWCLYTVIGPEREFKRRDSTGASSI